MGELLVPSLPVTATGKGSSKPSGGFRRGYSPQVVLLMCVGAFIAGRYLETLADLGMLPSPGGTKEVVIRAERSSPGANAPGKSHQPASVRNSFLQVNSPPSHSINRRDEGEQQQQQQQEQEEHPPGKGVSLKPEGNSTTFQQRDIARITKDLLLEDVPLLQPGSSGNGYYNAVPFQILSWYPRIVLFPRFLDDAKCDHVVEIGKKRLYQSGLVLRKGETTEGTRDIRTSSGAFLSSSSDPEGVLGEVDQRISDWINIPKGHFEPFNLLRYQLGQHYDSHYDAFDESYGPQPSQRVATVLLYLSTPEEGGETVFPLEGPEGLERLRGIDYKRCDMGFRYQPRKGDALLFWSMHPNGTMDKHSLHGGCPVKKGEKWVITKWIRDKCFGRC